MHQYDRQDVEVFLAAARAMTVASALSYASEEDACELMRDNHGDWAVRVLEHDNAEAMLLMAENLRETLPDHPDTHVPVVIVAFRGTEVPDNDGRRQFFPDWLRNLSFELTDYDRNNAVNGRAAKGILEAWRGTEGGSLGLKDQILACINEYSRSHRNTEVHVYVTGHSQGGALAAVSLLDLLNEQASRGTYVVKGCLTIAQPKVGDAAYSTAVGNAVESAGIPFDIVANCDATGVDPFVGMPPATWSPETTTPVGRFWKVRVGRTTHGPGTQESHQEVAEASLLPNIRRLTRSMQLHWPGGNTGYLAALAE